MAGVVDCGCRHGRVCADAGYKYACYGVQFVQVDPWFADFGTCSACGAVKVALSLSERTCCCDRCGFECDRDLNASRNIQAYPVAGLTTIKRVETGRTAGQTDRTVVEVRNQAADR